MSLTVPGREAGFRHVRCQWGTLVLPTANKHHFHDSERWFRSMIVSDHGQVLSVGFPKFGNKGEPLSAEAERVIAQQLPSGDVWITDKVDGSLMIRSVIDGQVVLRTRGTADGGPMRQALWRAASQYPKLSDPAWEPGRSLLFEFVSPDPKLRVVVRYSAEDVTLLGAVDHATLRLDDQASLTDLAASADVPLVRTALVGSTMKELERTVRDWEGREGVVVRSADGQHLLKIKSASYLVAHRLRANLSVDAIRTLCVREDISDLDGFLELMRRGGADWEILRDARPVAQAVVDARVRARERTAELDGEVDMACITAGSPKAAAAQLREQLPPEEHQAALLLLDGRYQAARSALESTLLDAATRPFAERDLALSEDLT
jgi:hypothetical protein